MFKIDDYIMYGTTGVCKLEDIRKERFMDDEEKEYYVLSPVYSKKTTIKIPVDNKKVFMRKIHSKEEVSSLIDGMANKETLWIDEDKERDSKFKAMLKTGDCEELIVLIKSICANKEIRKLVGKKINKADDDIMKVAKNLLNEEFATVLDISIEEVASYIQSNVPESESESE
ncbi:MAG: CarD family transcriptional regulator [Clostridium sp.]